MNRICVDLRNKRVGIFSDTHHRTEYNDRVTTEDIRAFVPNEELLEAGTSFTFDFEREEFSINKPIFVEEKVVMNINDFEPINTVPAKGLREQFNNIVDVLGIDIMHMTDEELMQIFVTLPGFDSGE